MFTFVKLFRCQEPQGECLGEAYHVCRVFVIHHKQVLMSCKDLNQLLIHVEGTSNNYLTLIYSHGGHFIHNLEFTFMIRSIMSHNMRESMDVLLLLQLIIYSLFARYVVHNQSFIQAH